MAWEWSHTQEAYDTAEKNLYKKSRKFLSECYGEIKANQPPDGFEHQDNDFDEALYNEAMREAASMDKEELADFIWTYASEDLRTCDNGGYSPWMCPHGCHQVEW